MIGLIITAAGKATRFGSDKTCYKINNHPVFAQVLTVFSKIIGITQCCVVCNNNNISIIKSYVDCYEWPFKINLTIGGDTRFESVKNGFTTLKACKKILIHDVARPFICANLINKIIKDSDKHVAVIPGIYIADTIKECDSNGLVKKTLNRDDLRAIQTPQCFHYDKFKEAIKDFNNVNITDESQLFEFKNIPVHITNGDPKNIKITWKTDL